jgi:excisionase family DNA binding protein
MGNFAVGVIGTHPEATRERAQREIPDVMTVGEVAKLLKVSKQVVYQLIKADKIPSIKVGKQYRVLAGQGFLSLFRSELARNI